MPDDALSYKLPVQPEPAVEMDEVSYRFNAFRVLRFGFDAVSYQGDGVPEVEFKLGLSLQIEPDKDQITVFVRVVALPEGEDAIEENDEGKLLSILGTIETESVFDVQDLARFRTDDGLIRIDDGTMATFVSAAYATTRGALIVRTTGSALQHVPLPFVNPLELLANLPERMSSGTNVQPASPE